MKENPEDSQTNHKIQFKKRSILESCKNPQKCDIFKGCIHGRKKGEDNS